jgi:hypothetical protein
MARCYIKLRLYLNVVHVAESFLNSHSRNSDSELGKTCFFFYFWSLLVRLYLLCVRVPSKLGKSQYRLGTKRGLGVLFTVCHSLDRSRRCGVRLWIWSNEGTVGTKGYTRQLMLDGILRYFYEVPSFSQAKGTTTITVGIHKLAGNGPQRITLGDVQTPTMAHQI